MGHGRFKSGLFKGGRGRGEEEEWRRNGWEEERTG